MQNATILRVGTLALAFSLVLGGCGGAKRAENNAANTMQNAAAQHNAATSEGAVATGGGMEADAGSPNMNCGTVKPVWVNTKSGTYHEPGDPYYGHTKHGKYMCPSAAHSAGYRASRSSHGAHSDTTQQ